MLVFQSDAFDSGIFAYARKAFEHIIGDAIERERIVDPRADREMDAEGKRFKLDEQWHHVFPTLSQQQIAFAIRSDVVKHVKDDAGRYAVMKVLLCCVAHP